LIKVLRLFKEKFHSETTHYNHLLNYIV